MFLTRDQNHVSIAETLKNSPFVSLQWLAVGVADLFIAKLEDGSFNKLRP